VGLFNTEVTAILANKLLLPIKVWNNISKSSKKQIKELFIQTTHNPYNCFVHTTNKKCKLKEAAAELGRKPISACFGCKMSEHKDKCMSKSSKYIKFELSNLEANKVLVNILKDEGYDLKFKDIRTLPKLKNPWAMDYSKLDKSRSSEQLRLAKLWNENRNGVLVCPPRFGKCLVGNTLIPTNNGLIPIQDLTTYSGDTIKPIDIKISNYKNKKESATTFFTEESEETIYIRTSYGHELEGTPEHPIICLDKNFNIKWTKLRDLNKGDVVCISTGQNLWSNTDTILPKNNISKKITPKLARLIGYLIANGGLTDIAKSMFDCDFIFSSKNKYIIKDIKSIIEYYGGRFEKNTKYVKNRIDVCDYLVYAPKLTKFLKNIVGLRMVNAHNKEIPACILTSTKEIITECLSAYFSCDSYIHSSYVELCTASKQLSYQLQVILNNYGIISKRTSYMSSAANSNSPKERRYFTLYINGNEYKLFREIFNITKKCHNDTKDYTKSWHIPIPGLKEYLINVQNKYPHDSGWYEINGKKVRTGLFNNPKFTLNKKSYISKNTIKMFGEGWNVLEDGLYDRLQKLELSNNNFFEIAYIKRKKEKVRVYDIVVPKTHSFSSGCFISHNTLLTAFVGQKLETRILILVHKIDLARQFYSDYLQFTTLKNTDIEINPHVSKMEKLKVCICTYQQFIGKYGKDRLKICKKLFGFIVVDEIHKAASDEFHKVINSFYARYRLGVTATPKRRDNKQFKNDFTFGPLLAKGGAEQLPCDYIITNTKWMAPPIPSSDKGWNGLWNKLAKDEHRNNFIAKKVITDLNNNHRVMLPVKRHAQIALLSKLIRKKCHKEGLNVKICEYHGELHKQVRAELQNDIRKGKYDVVIGNEQIISLGFNAPPMSCIYINLHTYRTFEEDLYQEFSRIRTQYKKKEKPLIRIFEDIGDLSDKSIQAIEKVMRKYKFTKRQSKKSDTTRSKGGLRCIM
jgi:intein/homing endonuclease